MIAAIVFVVLGFVFWIDTHLTLSEIIAITIGTIGILLSIKNVNTPDDPTHQRWTRFP